MTALINTPKDQNWHSYVEDALVIKDSESIDWFDSADVVVVGFGAAGVSAALEARAQGAEVLAIDRFNGGGATAVSGGVYYAGGGTRIQREAGVDDPVEEMYKYLKVETQGIVQDETLRRFCEQSSTNLDWLTEHGVQFKGALYKKKTVYPPDGYFLYYAGNEQLGRYKAHAKPAARGHRAVGKGIFCGKHFFEPLRASAIEKGVRLLTHSPVTRLVIDEHGAVVGVEINQIEPNSPAWTKHEKGINWFNKLLRFEKGRAVASTKKLLRLEADNGSRKLIKARRGVVLSTGSFAFNREMVKHYAEGYEGAMPVGSAGCDGSGIRLGQTAGGAISQMHKISAWRWISPPLAFVEGIVVNKDAQRFVEEDSYSGRLGEQIGEYSNHQAYLIIDQQSYKAAWKEAFTFNSRFAVEGLPIIRTLLSNCKKARSIAKLSQYYDLPTERLEKTVTQFNEHAARGEDPIGKTPTYLRPIGDGPYYIIDISTGNQITLCASIPMGGLKVDENTGHVLRDDRSSISGLFAAGRNAIGIPSHFYVSGTSIADCVFAGRRAGLNAALSTATNAIKAPQSNSGR